MQGRDAAFSSFGDERFDEAAFEAQLTAARTPTVICLYWIRKLKARYLAGDYAEAWAAADKAKALLGISSVQLQLFDYFYYAALTVAALYEEASADQQSGWRELLTAHREQLREWAENYPPTFSDKYFLVSAELARIEGRDADAMRLYEQRHSIRSRTRLRSERGRLPMRWQHGSTPRVTLRPLAHAYLSNARNCYERWGALGKVQQLDESTHGCTRNGPCFYHRHHRHAGRPVGRRDCTKSLTGTVQRDSSPQADREAHANRG